MDKDEERVAFLLKEYDQLWDQARHVDEFQDRVPRLFIVVVGAVLAAGAFFAREATPSAEVHRLGGASLVALALVGLLASLSIPRFRVIRNEYWNAIIAIRGHFKRRLGDELKGSLWFPTSGIFDSYATGWFNAYRDYRRNDFFRFLMMIVIDSGLLGLGMMLITNPRLLSSSTTDALWWVAGLSAAGSAVIHLVGFYWIVGYYLGKHLENAKRLDSEIQ